MSYLDKLRALESPKAQAEEPTKPTKAPFVGFVGTRSGANADIRPAEALQTYTPADLAEMDAILVRLSELEEWEAGELEARLDERRRMAPVNVQNALQALRAGLGAALAGWPEKPQERAQFSLCRLIH